MQQIDRMPSNVPASVARMQAKASQLATELELAHDALERPGSQQTGSHEAQGSSNTAAASARLPGSLATSRRLSLANLPGKTSSPDSAHLISLHCQKLEAQLQMCQSKQAEHDRELQRHQESYMRREACLQAQVAQLEQQLQQQQQAQAASPFSFAGRDTDEDAAACAGGKSSSSSSRDNHLEGLESSSSAAPLTLEAVQQQVQLGVEELLKHQRLQLRAAEAAQLRQFHNKLAEVEAQLVADKQAAAADQDSWMSKTVSVRDELTRTQEIAVKLDAMYRMVEDEAARLRVQFHAQEDDRQHLIRQVLGLKRQNHHLQQQLTAVQEELEAIMAIGLDENVNLSLLQYPQQQQQQSRAGPASRPRSAIPQQQQARPGTAGPVCAAHQQQQQQQEAVWRPQSSSSTRHPTQCAGAAAAAQDPTHHQQQQQHCQRVIRQLQKALQCERKQLRQLRATYTTELGRRNELQALLLDSIQQAKQQYQQAAAGRASGAVCGGGGPPPSCQSHPPANSSSSRPSSKMQARLQCRPASAAPACGANKNQQQQQLCSAMDWFKPVSKGSPSAWSSLAVAPVSSLVADGVPEGPRGDKAGAAAAAAAGDPEHAHDQHVQQVTHVSPVDEGVLDPQAWSQLLGDLLMRQHVLEMLLERACPDFVQAVQQMYKQGHAAGEGPPFPSLQNKRAADQQAPQYQGPAPMRQQQQQCCTGARQCQQQQQQQQCCIGVQHCQQQQQQEQRVKEGVEGHPEQQVGPAGPQQVLRPDCQLAEMFAIHENEGVGECECESPGTGASGGQGPPSRFSPREPEVLLPPRWGLQQQGACAAAQQPRDEVVVYEHCAHQQQHASNQQHHLREERLGEQQQQGQLGVSQAHSQGLQHMLLTQTPHKRATTAPAPDCRQKGISAAAGAAADCCGKAAARGSVALGSMSGPVMASFPVRKLLHSSSSGSSGSRQGVRCPARGSATPSLDISVVCSTQRGLRRPGSAAVLAAERGGAAAGLHGLACSSLSAVAQPKAAAVGAGTGDIKRQQDADMTDTQSACQKVEGQQCSTADSCQHSTGSRGQELSGHSSSQEGPGISMKTSVADACRSPRAQRTHARGGFNPSSWSMPQDESTHRMLKTFLSGH